MHTKNRFTSWLVYNKQLKQSSVNTVMRRYDFFFSWRAKRPLTPNLIETFIIYLRERKKRNQTINGYVLLFKYLSEFLKKNLAKNIAFFPKEHKVPTILSVEEIQDIINAPAGRFDNARGVNVESSKKMDYTIKLAVYFLAATGCRIDEMASLTKECLTLGDGGYALFKDTKTSFDRRVPLPPPLMNQLAELVKEKKPNEYVFTSRRGNKLIEQTFNPILREKVGKAGVNKHVHAHAFRNSFIMEHIRQGTDLLTIAKLVGHADVNTTMGYTKFTYEDIQKGAENHPLFAKNLSPSKLLERLEELVSRWPIRRDSRFDFSFVRKEKMLLVKICCKA